MSNYFFNIFYNKIITQFFLIFFLTLPVQAIEKTEVNRLVQVLNLKDLFQELQNEGVTAGIEMLKEEGQQSQEWVSKLNEIYFLEQQPLNWLRALPSQVFSFVFVYQIVDKCHALIL